MTDRFGLNAADLADQSPREHALDEAQEAYFRAECARRGWLFNGEVVFSKLTPEQVFEITESEGYPR